MRSRLAQWLVAVGLGSSLALPAGHATARLAIAGPGDEPAPRGTRGDDEAIARTLVLVGIVENDAPFSAAGLAAGLESHFAGSERQVRVEPLRAGTRFMDHLAWAAQTAKDPAVHAVFWIEPLSGGRYRLYLFDAVTEQLWVRAVAQGEAEDVLETTSIMIRGAALGLTTGPVGLEPATAGQPEAPVVATPPSGPSEARDSSEDWSATKQQSPVHTVHVLGLSYYGANLDDRARWQSGLAGHLGIHVPRGAFVRLGAAFVAQVRTRDLTVWRVPVVLAAGYAFRSQRKLRIEVDASAVIEAFWWRSEDSSEWRGRSGITGRFALGPGAGLTWQLVRGFGLHARVRLEVWLANVDLVAERDAVRTSRFLPHPASAAMEAGFHYAF